MDVNKNTLRSNATRARLVATARPLFAQRGFAGVGTEEIVRGAGLTRGALYHHFESKEALFRAVYEQVEEELSERIGAQALASGGPLVALETGASLFLDACASPEVQRIALLDAPSVLGWEVWREVGARFGLGMIAQVLQAAIDADELAAQPVMPLAHLLMGALDEAALMVARDPAVRGEVGDTLLRILRGLRPPLPS